MILTRCENEITALLGQGLRNRDIAERLVISPQTMAVHIEHIRGKLRYHSRVDIAEWARRQV